MANKTFISFSSILDNLNTEDLERLAIFADARDSSNLLHQRADELASKSLSDIVVKCSEVSDVLSCSIKKKSDNTQLGRFSVFNDVFNDKITISIDKDFSGRLV